MALLRVVSDIQSAAGNGQCTAVLALDISSAFDAVDHGTLTDRARTRHGTGSHFVTQRPSDPGIQRTPETQLTWWSIMNSKCRLMCRGVRIDLFTVRVLCRVSYRVLDKVSK